jgi:sugar/nucleoside kinase (ribokinase family)
MLGRMSLAVTGTIGIDTVYTPRERREGVLGGSAAYFAAGASFLSPVRLVAVVGDDWPTAHRAALGRFKGICTQGLEVRPGSRTFSWGGRYFEDVNQRETLFTEVGVLQEAPPRVPDAYRDTQFVFLGNTHPAVQADFIDQFPQRRLVVCDTMDLWIKTAHSELLSLLKRVDGVVLNDTEAHELTGIRNAVSAARHITTLGPTFAVVKKGEHGAVLVHRDGVAVLPAFPAPEERVIDPTGAGDSFSGGMMGHLARLGRTDFKAIRDALSWGTVVASFTIEAFGPERLQSLTATELNERHEHFRSALGVGS